MGLAEAASPVARVRRHPDPDPGAALLHRPVAAHRGADRDPAGHPDRAHRPRRGAGGQPGQRLAGHPHPRPAHPARRHPRLLPAGLADPAGRAGYPAHPGERLRGCGRGGTRTEGRGPRHGHDVLAAGTQGGGAGGLAADHPRPAHWGDIRGSHRDHRRVYRPGRPRPLHHRRARHRQLRGGGRGSAVRRPARPGRPSRLCRRAAAGSCRPACASRPARRERALPQKKGHTYVPDLAVRGGRNSAARHPAARHCGRRRRRPDQPGPGRVRQQRRELQQLGQLQPARAERGQGHRGGGLGQLPRGRAAGRDLRARATGQGREGHLEVQHRRPGGVLPARS